MRTTQTSFHRKSVFLVAFAVLVGGVRPAAAQDPQLLVLSQTIPLPRIAGGFNHISVDAAHRRLFLTATTKKAVEVINLASGEIDRELAGVGPAAALFISELNQLYVTRGNNVCIYDGASLDLTVTVDLHSRLDELACDPKLKRLYVGYMGPSKFGVGVLSLPEGSLQGVIHLPAKPQGFVVEQSGDRIFANTPTLGQVAVLDRKKEAVIGTWDLKNSRGNYPIGLDEANHRLFLGCRKPAQLLVLDTTSGTQVAAVPISEDTDDLSFDAKHNRVYVACGSGFLDVIGQRSHDSCALLQRIPTREGARNSCFSPESNKFYLGVPATGGKSAEVCVYSCR